MIEDEDDDEAVRTGGKAWEYAPNLYVDRNWLARQYQTYSGPVELPGIDLHGNKRKGMLWGDWTAMQARQAESLSFPPPPDAKNSGYVRNWPGWRKAVGDWMASRGFVVLDGISSRHAHGRAVVTRLDARGWFQNPLVGFDAGILDELRLALGLDERLMLGPHSLYRLLHPRVVFNVPWEIADRLPCNSDWDSPRVFYPLAQSSNPAERRHDTDQQLERQLRSGIFQRRWNSNSPTTPVTEEAPMSLNDPINSNLPAIDTLPAMKVVVVEFIDGKERNYFAPVEAKDGDYAVVYAPGTTASSKFTVGKILRETPDPEGKARAAVLGTFNEEFALAVQARMDHLAAIKARLQAKKRAFEERALFEMMAGTDPEAAELLRQLKELQP